MSAASIIAIFAGSGIVLSIGVVIAFLRLQRREDRGWSLSSAMSEVIGFDKLGAPIFVSSSSRFIALFGFILIFWIFAAIGLEIIVAGGTVPVGLKDIEGYLMFGLAMFAPYIANQARAALVGLGKGLPKDLPAQPEAKDPQDAGTARTDGEGA